MIKTFNAQKKDIKIAVERLIGKELLQRDEKDITKIKYVDWVLSIGIWFMKFC